LGFDDRGYVAAKGDRERSRWIATVSVEDVEVAAKAAVANGGKILEAPSDLAGVGSKAHIADPQGAELGLLTDARGDKPDPQVPSRGSVWNELHTTEPASAIRFYEKVFGFTHRPMDMGTGGTYHVLSRDGIDRGGVTGHLPAGALPHWLPYVASDDV
jgi:predicted enzyme related to lactoylglutathione lyase